MSTCSVSGVRDAAVNTREANLWFWWILRICLFLSSSRQHRWPPNLICGALILMQIPCSFGLLKLGPYDKNGFFEDCPLKVSMRRADAGLVAACSRHSFELLGVTLLITALFWIESTPHFLTPVFQELRFRPTHFLLLKG